MVLSYLYEGDMAQLGGYIVMTKRIRTSPLSSMFNCELVLNKKKYECTVKMIKWGGWKIVKFKNDSDAKEVLDYYKSVLTSNYSVLKWYLIKIFARLFIYFLAILVPFYFVLNILFLSRSQILLCALLCIICEIFLYIMRGLLNKI